MLVDRTKCRHRSHVVKLDKELAKINNFQRHRMRLQVTTQMLNVQLWFS